MMIIEICNLIVSVLIAIATTFLALWISKSKISYSLWRKELSHALKKIYSTLSELEIALNSAIPVVTSCCAEKERKVFQDRYPDLNKIYKRAYHA